MGVMSEKQRQADVEGVPETLAPDEFPSVLIFLSVYILRKRINNRADCASQPQTVNAAFIENSFPSPPTSSLLNHRDLCIVQ